jgi:hypothetical protein
MTAIFPGLTLNEYWNDMWTFNENHCPSYTEYQHKPVGSKRKRPFNKLSYQQKAQVEADHKRTKRDYPNIVPDVLKEVFPTVLAGLVESYV